MNSTILLADDQCGIRQYCKQELETEGYRVLLAQDGEEALEILAQNEVDLVVLDEHMPGCSGTETARYIKSQASTLPVVLFTLDSDYARYHSPFVNCSVIKSVDLGELKHAIQSELTVNVSGGVH